MRCLSPAAARCNGEFPTSSTSLGRYPAFINNHTILKWPPKAAQCNGVFFNSFADGMEFTVPNLI